MTTLATAAVEIVADTDGFEQSLTQGLTRAGGAADRASQSLGRRVGTAVTTSASKAMSGLSRSFSGPLSQAQSALTRIGRTAQSAFAPALASTRALTANLRGVSAAGGPVAGVFTRIGSTAHSLGSTMSTAFAVGRQNLSLLAQGIRGVGVQASAANAPFYRLGTTIAAVGARASTAFASVRAGLDSIATRFRGAAGSANILNNSLSRMGALAGGLAAAAGIAELGGQIATVASSAQTTRASLTALYEAAGGGAAEVNDLMAQMQDRFRGLDMSAMNQGATALAYMGVQGEDAVNVLDNLQKATTASGTGVDGLSRAFDAMTQGVNAGKFQMDTLNQISDAGIPIYDALADVLGTDIPTAQKMATDGAVELEDVLAALSGEAGTWFPALLEGADNVSQTFSGSWDTIRNTFVNGVANELVPLLDRLSPAMNSIATGVETAFEKLPEIIDNLVSRGVDTGAFDALSTMFSGLRSTVSGLAPLFSGFASGLGAAGSAAATVLGWLRPLGEAFSSLGGFLRANEDAVRVVGTALGGLAAGLAVYRTAALLGTAASYVLSTSFRGIGVAIRGIPLIGWVLAAIGALIALYQTSDTFREKVNAAFAAVRDAVQAAWEYIEPAWDALADGLSRLWSAISGWEGWQAAWSGIQAAVSGAWSVISTVWDAITTAWDDLTTGVGDTSWWTDTWTTVTDALSTAWDLISLYFDQIADAWNVLTGFLSGEAGLSDLGQYILDSFGRLREAGGIIGDFLMDQLRELPGRAQEALSSLGTALVDWFTGLPGRVSEVMSGEDGDGGILGWLQELPGRATEMLIGFGETLVGWFKSLPGMIRENIDPGAIIAWLREVPGRVLEFMQNYGPQILKGFAIAIGVVILGIPALLLGLLAAILLVLGTIAWELATWAWNAFTSMMTTAGQAVMAGINSVVAWFTALPGRIMAGIVNFGARLAVWGRTAIGSLRLALSTGMAALRAWWNTAWNTVYTLARNVWSSMTNWVATQAGTLRDRVMGPINNLRSRMIGAFRSARDGIGRAWDGVKSKVGKPVAWVINTGYNDWLRGVWRKVTDKFGGPELPSYTVKFAKGGVFPGYTPGRDIHSVPMAAFSGGESVLRPEVTRAWGARTTLMLNKLARTGGVKAVRKALAMLFAGHNPFTGRSVPRTNPATGGGGFAQRFDKGGILDRVTGSGARAAKWLKSTGNDFGDGMADFLDDPGGTLRKIFDQVMDYTKMPGWGTKWTSLLARVPKKIIDRLVKKAKELFSFDGDWLSLGGNVGGRLGTALAFAKAQAGKPYIWGGVGPRGYDCCIVPGVRVYGPNGAKKIEDVRPGDKVYSYVDGRLVSNTVNAVWQSKYQEVFEVRTRNRKVTASANHPFMRLVRKEGAKATAKDEADWPGPVKMPPGSRGTMVCMVSTCETIAWSRGMCGTHLAQWRKHGDPRIRQTTGAVYEVAWARLDELKHGDLLVQPRQMQCGGEEVPLLPGGFPVTEDFAWLVGACVGDGTITDRGLRLALYGEKRERATRVIKDLFGGNPTHGESYGIVASNKALQQVLDSMGMRRKGPDKRVPNAVWGWSQTLQRAFLDGYCDADGSRPDREELREDRTYHSASKELIEDVRALHISLGDPVSNVSLTERTKPIVIKGKRVKNPLPQYSFAVWKGPGRGEAALRVRPGIAQWLDGGDFTLAKVLEVTPKGKQETWDMEVDQAHNFIADGVVVHNSGFMSAIHNVILGKRPYSRRYTTHPFTGSAYGGFRRNFPSPFTIGVTHAGVGHMAGTLLKTNVESRGSVGVVVGSRARGTGSSLFSHKYGMVGAAPKRKGPMGGEGITYDTGGALLPGWTAVYNGTRRPETVRTYAQEERVARLVRLVEKAAPLASGPLVPADQVGALARALGVDGQAAGTVVNAPVTVTTYAADPETVAYKTAARIARLAGV